MYNEFVSRYHSLLAVHVNIYTKDGVTNVAVD